MAHSTIRLPFGIVVERVSKVYTRISSELRREFIDSSLDFDAHGELAARAVEALLVALVAEGIEMDAAAAGRAVTTAAESIAEYLARPDD